MTAGGIESEAAVLVGEEGIEISAGKRTIYVDFSSVLDFRLINYHFHLYTKEGETVLSKMGLDTEGFFENFWLAFDARTRRSLFLKSAAERESEGDYTYTEDGKTYNGKAKVSLFEDCLCLLPHNIGARRIPLCFADKPAINGYQLTVNLDTGESYTVARLGHDTLPFFEKLEAFRNNSTARWNSAHAELEKNIIGRLGELAPRYEFIKQNCDRVFCGLFSPDNDAFWFAGIKNNKAAAELIIGESAATYLYEFSVPDVRFEADMRHAYEAVNANREVIYADEQTVAAKPLYQMAIDRSSHVRFLRGCSAGRIIHNAAWQKNMLEFLQN